ncbi:MAG: glycosyltransferase [Ferruginibacter sp.]
MGGDLDKNKDPLTLLNAFEKYILDQPAARLYMIFQDKTLLTTVERKIASATTLEEAVKLIGYVAHNELPCWYSAADFYISCSYKEGSGYALLEAMACGCIPVVTNIPSFRKITVEGRYGFLFSPGNAEVLTTILNNLTNINADKYSAEVENHFNERLSFKNIADDLYQIFNEVV